MARFEFKLEGVLRHRKRVEQQKQRELAVLRGQMTVMEEQLKALDHVVKDANEDMRRNRLTGMLDLAFVAAHRRFLAATQQRAMELIQKMALMRRRVEESQKVVAIAAKDRKMIEKLREREQTRWAAEIGRKEAVEMDEIGTQLGFANLSQAE